MHLRREIDKLLDESIEIKEKLNTKSDKTEDFQAQLKEIKDKIKELTREGRGNGLWTDSPEFLVKSIF